MSRLSQEIENDDASGTVFRDVVLLALCGFVAIVLIILPHLNPDGERQTQVSACPQGDMIVEAHWNYGVDADLDLWVRAPGDTPVGYSNKGGIVFNLLRDDLGMRGDFTGTNMEMAVARFIPDGTFTVNLHSYRNPSAQWPLTAKIRVSVCDQNSKRLTHILESETTFERDGVEKTIFSFDILNKALVPGSVHNVPVPLRSWRPTGGN